MSVKKSHHGSTYKIAFYRRLTGEQGDMADTEAPLQTSGLSEAEARTIKDVCEKRWGGLTDFHIVCEDV